MSTKSQTYGWSSTCCSLIVHKDDRLWNNSGHVRFPGTTQLDFKHEVAEGGGQCWALGQTLLFSQETVHTFVGMSSQTKCKATCSRDSLIFKHKWWAGLKDMESYLYCCSWLLHQTKLAWILLIFSGCIKLNFVKLLFKNFPYRRPFKKKRTMQDPW